MKLAYTANEVVHGGFAVVFEAAPLASPIAISEIQYVARVAMLGMARAI